MDNLQQPSAPRPESKRPRKMWGRFSHGASAQLVQGISSTAFTPPLLVVMVQTLSGVAAASMTSGEGEGSGDDEDELMADRLS